MEMRISRRLANRILQRLPFVRVTRQFSGCDCDWTPKPEFLSEDLENARLFLLVDRNPPLEEIEEGEVYLVLEGRKISHLLLGMVCCYPAKYVVRVDVADVRFPPLIKGSHRIRVSRSEAETQVEIDGRGLRVPHELLQKSHELGWFFNSEWRGPIRGSEVGLLYPEEVREALLDVHTHPGGKILGPSPADVECAARDGVVSVVIEPTRSFVVIPILVSNLELLPEEILERSLIASMGFQQLVVVVELQEDELEFKFDKAWSFHPRRSLKGGKRDFPAYADVWHRLWIE